MLNQNPISINHVVKLLNVKKKYIFKRPGEPYQTNADIKKLKELRWSPKISLRKV